MSVFTYYKYLNSLFKTYQNKIDKNSCCNTHAGRRTSQYNCTLLNTHVRLFLFAKRLLFYESIVLLIYAHHHLYVSSGLVNETGNISGK